MAADTEIETTEDFVTTADRQPHPTLPPLALDRGKDLDALLDLLRRQQTVKYDRVVAADRMSYVDGKLCLHDAIEGEAILTEDGVTPGRPENLYLAPTAIFEDQIAGRLEIPQRYVRKMRTASHEDEYGNMVALLDRNVNAWLAETPDRLFTVRGFYDPESRDGIARSIMSGRYAVVDHLDQLAAVLMGLADVAKSNPAVARDALSWKVDLTERTMRVRLIAPQISIMAPELLAGYRDPWNGRYSGSTGDTPPVLQAGLDIRNSETGGGAALIVPFLHVLACSNGLTVTQDALRKVHIGSEQFEGRIEYSAETQRKMNDAIQAQTADAVGKFLSVEWLQATADKYTEQSKVKVDDAKGTLEHVAKQHKIGDAERDAIFELFLMSGQRTAGGVAQAITAHAHTATPNRAMELDDIALRAMATAAKYAAAHN